MRRDKLAAYGRWLVSVLLLVFFFLYVDFGEVIGSFSNLDLGYAALSLVLLFIGTVFTKSVLIAYWTGRKSGFFCAIFEFVKVHTVLRFYTIVLPRPVVVGVRWYKYSKVCAPEDALAVLGMESLLYLAVVVCFAVSAALLDPIAEGFFDIHPAHICMSIVVLIAPFVWRGRLIEALSIGEKHRYWGMFCRPIKKVYESFFRLRLISRESLVIATIISVLSFVFFILSSYILALGMSLEIPFLTLVWVRAAVFLVALAPITVGGVGLREAGFIFFLGIAGVAPAQALAYSLACYSLQVVLGLIGAGIELKQAGIKTWIKK